VSFIHIAQARNEIQAGGVVAYPTEAVWGLGCDPFNQRTVEKILALKRRPVSKGLLLIAGDQSLFAPLLAFLPQERRQIVEASWPGPNTWVLPDPGIYPGWVRGCHNSVAVRVTDHPVVRALTMGLNYPIISTSANTAGQVPARTLLQTRCYFADQVEYYLPGTLGGLGKPSTIRDALTGAVLRY